MKYTFSDILLYTLATIADHNRRAFSWSLATTISDDPRLTKHRRRIKKYINDKHNKDKVFKTYYNLKKRKYIIETNRNRNNEMKIEITKKGREKLLKFKVPDCKKIKMKRNEYLMVLFDIPERQKKKREYFRFLLKELGFEQIQKSIWISPYNLTNEVKEIVIEIGLQNFVIITKSKVIR